MTKYRKSVAKKATPAKKQKTVQKTGSDYNPETWTQQFFREKREAEERIQKVESSEGENSDGEKNEKGIPVEKGIPGM